MKINKAMYIALVAVAIFHAKGQCKTIHGSSNREVTAHMTKDVPYGEAWGAECVNWGSNDTIPDDDITIDWTTDVGENFTTNGCRSWNDDISNTPDYLFKKGNFEKITAKIHYRGQNEYKLDLIVNDKLGHNQALFRGTWVVSGGGECSVDVPSAIIFNGIKAGKQAVKELSSLGKGHGTLSFKPSSFNATGPTLKNTLTGSDTSMYYDIVGLGFGNGEFTTSDIESPYQIRLMPANNLPPGNYQGSLAVTLTCN